MVKGIGEENSDFKPVKFCIKIDFVRHPGCAEGLVNTYISSVRTLDAV